jgi:hypothetical protein
MSVAISKPLIVSINNNNVTKGAELPLPSESTSSKVSGQGLIRGRICLEW